MKILFITSSRIGDAVLSTGLLRHALEHHPGAEVAIATGPLAASLFAGVPGLKEILVLKKQSFKRHWLKFLAKTMPQRWDLVINLRHSPAANLVFARKRVAMGYRSADLHRVEELAALMALNPPPAPRLWLTPEAVTFADKTMQSGGPILALGPAANWAAKTWPLERFIDLAQRLTATDGPLAGARIAVFAAKNEEGAVLPLLESLPKERVIAVTGERDLLRVAACLARASLFVGNDSGLMHMAAAVGAPTLGLFGPSPEWRYRPWGERATFVRTRESYEDLVNAPAFDHLSAPCLMGGLEVDSVMDAARGLLT